MKKLTALILTLISACLILTGCGNQSLKLDEKYWQSSLTGQLPVDETSVYNVTVVNRTPSDSTEIKNDSIRLVVDEGKLVTHFVTDDTVAAYKLTSSLTIKGKYVVGDAEYEFEDATTSTTYLKKFEEKLKPVYTEKYVNNTTVVENSSGLVIAPFEYEYTINYGSSAVVNFNVIDDKYNALALHKGETSYSNYSEGAFVENEAILFIPRTFNITESYSQNFTTLDVISRKIQKCVYSSISGNSSSGVTTFVLPSFTHNGVAETNKSISTAKLYLKLNDTYSGSPIEAYYATDHLEMRHNLVKYYTALNCNLGYLEYSLIEVTNL